MYWSNFARFEVNLDAGPRGFFGGAKASAWVVHCLDSWQAHRSDDASDRISKLHGDVNVYDWPRCKTIEFGSI